MWTKTNGWQASIAEQHAQIVVTNPRVTREGSKLSILLFAIALLVLWAIPYSINITLESKGYEVQQVRARVVQLTKANEALRLEVGQLKSPGRIQAIAEKELGMRIPTVALYSSAGTNSVIAHKGPNADRIRD